MALVRSGALSPAVPDTWVGSSGTWFDGGGPSGAAATAATVTVGREASMKRSAASASSPSGVASDSSERAARRELRQPLEEQGSQQAAVTGRVAGGDQLTPHVTQELGRLPVTELLVTQEALEPAGTRLGQALTKCVAQGRVVS